METAMNYMPFPPLFNCHVPVELIGSRAFESLIIQYEAMHHGIYEIPPFVQLSHQGTV